MVKEIAEKVDRFHSWLVQRKISGNNGFVSKETMVHVRNLWIDAAVTLLEEELDVLEKKSNHRASLDPLKELRNKLREEKSELIDQSPDELMRSLRNKPRQLEESLAEAFKNTESTHPTLKKRLYEKYQDRLNKGQEWDIIEKELSFKKNGVRRCFSSILTPAARLGNIFSECYQGKGVSSGSIAECRHAVNLWVSELRNETGQVLFKGLRHSVHSAYGIKEDTDRIRANRARALETIEGALVTDQGLLEKALNHETVKLGMVSISLLTPDNFRSLYSETANERKYLKEQLSAWEWWNELSKKGEGIEFSVRNRRGELQKVRIRTEVVMFNFGVNEAAVVGKFGLSSKYNLVSGWGNVRTMNLDAMNELIGNPALGGPIGGKVGEYLGGRPEDSDTSIIRKLTEQIRKIWMNETYMTMGHEPYKMVSRLAVLAYLTGHIPVWNCKSGKDRAGLMDVETKFLVTQIALSGDVPEPDRQLNREDREIFRKIALESGNLEIQRLNTGLPGFKTEGVPAIDERLGSPEIRAIYRGGSQLVRE